MNKFDATKAKTALLDAMLNAGIPEDRVVFAIVGDPSSKKGIAYYYDTFVGATTDRDRAVQLVSVARDLVAEAQQQSHTTHDKSEICPKCKSQRYGIVQRAKECRIIIYMVCMDCGYEEQEKN